MTSTEHVDPDIAQARVFRALLDEEIAALTARIEATRRHGWVGADDPEDARLGGQLGEARQLVARLNARYPELNVTGRSARQ
ncbi:hypothetical protein ACWEK5_21540 [Rhodococcus koreensis]